jgi:hypothetical protein
MTKEFQSRLNRHSGRREAAIRNPFLRTFQPLDGFRACAFGASRNDGIGLVLTLKLVPPPASAKPADVYAETE